MIIAGFCQKFIELVIQEIHKEKISKREFYDYKEMSRGFNHSKVLKVICQTLEGVGYEWLTDVRINKTTVDPRLRSPVQYVADAIGYKPKTDPTNFSVIIEYETIDSAELKSGKLKILNYIKRMLDVKDIEFYVMIAVFTNTNTERTRNKEKDQWGMPRNRKIMYEQVISQMNDVVRELSERSKFALISIFDDKIVGQIFNKNGEKVENKITKSILIHEI